MLFFIVQPFTRNLEVSAALDEPVTAENNAFEEPSESESRVEATEPENDTYDEIYDLPSKITLNKSNATIRISGAKLVLEATTEPYDTPIKWVSSDNNIAIVDGNGVVTGVGIGTAVITATPMDGYGQSASCRVTVNKAIHNYLITEKHLKALGWSEITEEMIIELNNCQKEYKMPMPHWELICSTLSMTRPQTPLHLSSNPYPPQQTGLAEIFILPA